MASTTMPCVLTHEQRAKAVNHRFVSSNRIAACVAVSKRGNGITLFASKPFIPFVNEESEPPPV